MSRLIIPPIKSQGIKSKLVPWIASILPVSSGQWVEPFMGTGVVGFNLAGSHAVLADANPHLIDFYQAIKCQSISPQSVRSFLQAEGKKLLEQGQDYYYKARARFNQHKQPLDFLFVNRSCFNGMIRFNQKGDLNIPYCRKDNRFSQAYITKIVNQIDIAIS